MRIYNGSSKSQVYRTDDFDKNGMAYMYSIAHGPLSSGTPIIFKSSHSDDGIENLGLLAILLDRIHPLYSFGRKDRDKYLYIHRLLKNAFYTLDKVLKENNEKEN